MSLLSLETFKQKYGDFTISDFILATRDLELEQWTKYFMDLTLIMNKHLHKDEDNEDLKVVFVDHWKRKKFGWLVIKDVSDLPYRINSIIGNYVLECSIPNGDANGDDTEIGVHFVNPSSIYP